MVTGPRVRRQRLCHDEAEGKDNRKQCKTRERFISGFGLWRDSVRDGEKEVVVQSMTQSKATVTRNRESVGQFSVARKW